MAVLDKNNFYKNWKPQKIYNNGKYIKPKVFDIRFRMQVAEGFEIWVEWAADYVSQIFKPLYVQLIDVAKSGSNKYVCPDLLIKDIFAAGIKSDYKAFRHIDKWVKENLDKYRGE